MKLIQYIFVIMIFGIITSCKKTEIYKITEAKEYNEYLRLKSNITRDNLNLRLEFWNKKLKEDSTRIVALGPIAKVYTKLFQTTGEIEYLKKAEQTLKKSVEIAAIGKENYLLALARNYISQHMFIEAEKVAERALQIGVNKKQSEMVMFDIAMELGKYTNAKKYLESFANQEDYNFLIRLAKWNDYKGNLDATIRNMEKAKSIAEGSKKGELMLWSYTNLADYYGHAGRVKDSYDHYLKALEIDPANAYAKKGIAWIIYSYEYNPTEALRIINTITQEYQSPDYALFKVEIAEYQNNQEAKEKNLKNYFQTVTDTRYGDMYNSYNAMIRAEEFNDYDGALEIAIQEIKNRPTPQSYGLLAYILNLKGDHKKALGIVESHIIGKTYEPEVYYQIAQIYKTNQLIDKIAPIKKELLSSSYELGPLLTNKIQNL
ncbi:tetratricopeptide repeat protein [Aquimarina muelleri]|nr:tetratricopeptide repeat protein [Aquimarina muelleri]MCX2765017.1 tetratricopeptide repeat protein [Aquimarina muelleri]